MYYTDISNKELQYFRNLRIKNFTIKMSDMLSSDLFKVETVKEDSIYRVYPLFYTTEITCSNPNDRVLENKVIICQKLSSETYFSFISNPNEPIYDYAEYGSYFDVGDDLTENEFNGIISLLRKYVKHTDNIKISQGTVKGEYGNYIFNVNGTTVTDKGILITEETISNLGTVRLEDNVFDNSEYVLHLRVYHMTDVNVSGEVSSDNIVYEDLEVELVPHRNITIPFSQLDYDYVIGFNANVIINHDVPIIIDYELLFEDKGILTDYSDIWSTNTTSSIIKVTRTDSYTEFAELTSTNLTNTVSGLSENSIIEFDYYQVDGLNTNSFMNISNSNSATIYTGGINLNQFNAEIGKWYHFKISFKDGTMTMINETTGGTLNKNYTSIPYKFNFWTSSTITAIRFKNFIIKSLLV